MKLEKITKNSDAPSKRRYDDACGAAHALDLLGERWALLVVRELMLGPKRFSDLRADLPGLSANVLTQRLEGLEATGVLVKRRLPPPAGTTVYELTPWGYDSEPIFQTLGRWAARSPLHDPTLPISAVSLMLSFRTMFSAARAGDFAARIGFEMGEETFLVTITNGTLEAARAELDGAQAVFSGTAPMVGAAVYGGVPIPVLEETSALRVEGDRDVAARFVTLFPLPPKVGQEREA